MAVNSQSLEHVGLLRQFVDNLESVIVQIQDEGFERTGIETVTSFDSDAYWTRLGRIYQSLSAEATKLSLAFSSPPPPTRKQCEPLLGSLQGVVLALVSAYYSLPIAQGLTLRKSLKKSVLEIIQQVKSLSQSVADFTAGSSEQLQTTGQVWQHADFFPSLPKDNKEATLAVLVDTSELVNDALRELQEAVNNGGELDDVDEIMEADGHQNLPWTIEEETLVSSCTGLIKTVKSLLKKTTASVKHNGSCQSKMVVGELDGVVDSVTRLSPVVDDLAASLYPPISNKDVRDYSNTLASGIADHLSFIRHSHLSTEDDQQWVEFLVKANQHNLDKILHQTT